MRPVYRFYAISKMAFVLLCAAFFIGGCARKAPERIAEISQKQFILTDELGVKSRALISKISPANGEESRYKLVWLDMLGAPIARKILSITGGGEAKFRNDGFLPPDSQSERVFLALLENADKPNFTINAKGRRYDAVSK